MILMKTLWGSNHYRFHKRWRPGEAISTCTLSLKPWLYTLLKRRKSTTFKLKESIIHELIKPTL